MADQAAGGFSIPGVIGTDSGSGAGADLSVFGTGLDTPTPAVPTAPGDSPAGAGAGAKPPSGPESVAGATPDGQPAGLPAQAPPVPEPFEFAGQRFATRQEAEEKIKQALGRYSSAQSESAKLKVEREAIARERDQFRGIAESWDRWHREQQGKPKDPSSQQPPQAAGQGDQPWFNDLDFDLFQEVAEEKGLANALYGLVSEMDKHYSQRLEERLTAAIQPFQASTEEGRQFNQTMDLFGRYAHAEDALGNALYPELIDETAAADVVRVWRTLKPELALTDDGVQYAIWKYRQTNGGSAPAVAAPAGQAPPAGASGASGVLEHAARAAAASSEVLAGNGSPRPAAPGTQEATSFLSLINGAAPMARTPEGMNLGFMVATP